MAIKDKKISEVYSGRDISSLSDRPNESGLSGTQLKARFDQLGKEVIPQHNALIDELADVVLPAKVDVVAGKSLVDDTAITDLTDGGNASLHKHDDKYYTEAESDALLANKVDKVSGKSLISDSAITDLTDSGDTTLHKHDTMYYTEAESDALLANKVDKVADKSLVLDSVITDLTDAGDSILHYHASDRNRANHTGTQSADTVTDGTTNKAFTATEKTKLAGIEALAEVNNISDANATDLTGGGETTLHIHDGRYYTETEVNSLLSGKVDKVVGSSLVSDATITDLTDGNETTLHKHSASNIVNTPAGGIAATDVQTALNELDSEKANKGGTVVFDTTFNAAYLSGTWTASASTDTLTCSVDHGLVVGDPVSFNALTGVLPGGISAEPQFYYVISVPTTKTITISLTKAGTLLDITNDGTAGWGIRYARVAPASSTLDFSRYSEIDIFSLIDLVPSTTNSYVYISFAPTTGTKIILNDTAVYGSTREAGLSVIGLANKKFTKANLKINIRKIASSLYSITINYGYLTSDNLDMSSPTANGKVYIGQIFGADVNLIKIYDGYSNMLKNGSRIIGVAR